ncbi:response regulator transcription factor [Maritimibacter fusiformis]|uniref:Response regulator transcription factor n=2 Tax=Maritimibacter fusiformis TaxID=2603819 RepID=A0A5D0RPL9_9RHOB|nr:response regulator transcription factor [Maritimibacter fusiformis]
MVRADPSIGQVGFLPMNVEVDCWLSVLRLLVWGEYYIPASLMAQVQQAPMLSPEIPAPYPAVAREPDEGDEAKVEKIHLTERELQVLGSAAEGKQNKIIADELNLSQHTVKLHMHHVIAKLGVHNRTEAAIWYLNQYAQAQGR